VTKTVRFSRDQIKAYAEVSGDRNPIHLDETFARSVGLPGVIAHGMLQMGLLAGLAVAEAGGDPRRPARRSPSEPSGGPTASSTCRRAKPTARRC